jgi:hypothetical protein
MYKEVLREPIKFQALQLLSDLTIKEQRIKKIIWDKLSTLESIW